MAPMAISLAFGVLVATAFTLLLIPSAVLIAQDVKEGFQRLVRAIVPPPLPDESR